MRLMLAGDTHGNLHHLDRHLCPEAEHLDVDLIIQLGDFGFLFREDRVAEVHAVLERHDQRLWFLDGNHENFDLLASLGCTPDGDPFDLTDRIRYLPRGCRFDLGGARFMAFGGAISIDQAQRTAGHSWWPDEAITDRQIAAADGPPVDVLLTHDCPEIPDRLLDHLSGFSVPYKLDRASHGNRARVRCVYDAVRPRLVVHGHYHYRYDDRLPHGKVIGLDRDTTGPQSWVVIDTDDWLQQP